MNDSSCTGGCACSGGSTGTRGPGPAQTTSGTALGGGVTRRGVLAGSAAVVALALGACASSEEASGGATTATPPGTDAGTSPDGSSQSAPPSGEVLATTGEFPTGGGKVVTTGSGVVVVTQPADGQFKAFSGRCPHQGCPVTEVLENTIFCNCHGSTFDAETGDRMEGPAPVGLTPVAISVEGDQIVLA